MVGFKKGVSNMKEKVTTYLEKNSFILMMSSSFVLMALLITFVIYPLVSHADEDHAGWKVKHAQMVEEKMHQLHDRLKLNPQQEKSWLTFAEQMKNEDHHNEWDRQKMYALPTPERLDLMMARMKKRQERMESHIKAIKSFYAQLNPEQKKSFDESFREFEHQWHRQKEEKDRSERHHGERHHED